MPSSGFFSNLVSGRPLAVPCDHPPADSLGPAMQTWVTPCAKTDAAVVGRRVGSGVGEDVEMPDADMRRVGLSSDFLAFPCHADLALL